MSVICLYFVYYASATLKSSNWYMSAMSMTPVLQYTGLGLVDITKHCDGARAYCRRTI